jgi:hypothetical protein
MLTFSMAAMPALTRTAGGLASTWRCIHVPAGKKDLESRSGEKCAASVACSDRGRAFPIDLAADSVSAGRAPECGRKANSPAKVLGVTDLLQIYAQSRYEGPFDTCHGLTIPLVDGGKRRRRPLRRTPQAPVRGGSAPDVIFCVEPLIGSDASTLFGPRHAVVLAQLWRPPAIADFVVLSWIVQPCPEASEAELQRRPHVIMDKHFAYRHGVRQVENVLHISLPCGPRRALL